MEACLLEDISGNGVQIGTIDSYNISDPSAQDADNVVVDSVVRGVVRTTGSFHPCPLCFLAHHQTSWL